MHGSEFDHAYGRSRTTALRRPSTDGLSTIALFSRSFIERSVCSLRSLAPLFTRSGHGLCAQNRRRSHSSAQSSVLADARWREERQDEGRFVITDSRELRTREPALAPTTAAVSPTRKSLLCLIVGEAPVGECDAVGPKKPYG